MIAIDDGIIVPSTSRDDEHAVWAHKRPLIDYTIPYHIP